MNSHERRILLQLEQFDPDQPVVVWTPFPMRSGVSQDTHCVIKHIEHDGAVMRVGSMHLTPACECEIPVALVRALWRTTNGWNMAVEGTMLNPGVTQWSSFYPSII